MKKKRPPLAGEYSPSQVDRMFLLDYLRLKFEIVAGILQDCMTKVVASEVGRREIHGPSQIII